MTTPKERRDAALRAMRDHDVSQRRACRLVGVDPKTVRRDRPPDNADIRAAMREIAGKRRRFGYRRIGVLLEREGMTMNHSAPDQETVQWTVSPAQRSTGSTARRGWR